MKANSKNGPEYGRPLNGTGVLRIARFKMMNVHRIATWNFRTLYEGGKLRNLTKEMIRMNIQILGACEIRRSESGIIKFDGYTIYYSGSPKDVHQNGVAVILPDSLAQSVKNHVYFSERGMLLQLYGPVNINIVQVYAPTADKDDNEIEEFYEQVTEALSYVKTSEIVVITGDFNAKVGDTPTNKITGSVGLGDRNEFSSSR